MYGIVQCFILSVENIIANTTIGQIQTCWRVVGLSHGKEASYGADNGLTFRKVGVVSVAQVYTPILTDRASDEGVYKQINNHLGWTVIG